MGRDDEGPDGSGLCCSSLQASLTLVPLALRLYLVLCHMPTVDGIARTLHIPLMYLIGEKRKNVHCWGHVVNRPPRGGCGLGLQGGTFGEQALCGSQPLELASRGGPRCCPFGRGGMAWQTDGGSCCPPEAPCDSQRSFRLLVTLAFRCQPVQFVG